MPDRVNKALLALIAVALWGLLLRPLFPPRAAQAQADPPPLQATPAVVMDDKAVVIAAYGHVTVYPRNPLGEFPGANGGGNSYRYPVLPIR